MINVYIAHPSDRVAKQLAEELLKNKLVARLSIDYNNHVFEIDNEEITERSISLITAQTRALLFQEVVNFVHARYSMAIPIYSVPITQGNEELTHLIREKTKKI
jgi:uncharacterized protein involved in tolerance to divalent cations